MEQKTINLIAERIEELRKLYEREMTRPRIDLKIINNIVLLIKFNEKLLNNKECIDVRRYN